MMQSILMTHALCAPTKVYQSKMESVLELKTRATAGLYQRRSSIQCKPLEILQDRTRTLLLTRRSAAYLHATLAFLSGGPLVVHTQTTFAYSFTHDVPVSVIYFVLTGWSVGSAPGCFTPCILSSRYIIAGDAHGAPLLSVQLGNVAIDRSALGTILYKLLCFNLRCGVCPLLRINRQ